MANKTDQEKIAEVLAQFFVEVQEVLEAFMQMIEERARPGNEGKTPQLGVDFSVPTKEEIAEALKKDNSFTEKLKGKDGKDAEDITFKVTKNEMKTPVQISKEETPESIKQKLMSLAVSDKWFDALHIKGLKAVVDSLQGMRLGSGGGGSVEFFTISGDVNDSNTSFTLPREYTNPVICYNGQVLDPESHYSISGTTLTLTTAPSSGTLFGFGQPA